MRTRLPMQTGPRPRWPGPCALGSSYGPIGQSGSKLGAKTLNRSWNASSVSASTAAFQAAFNPAVVNPWWAASKALRALSAHIPVPDLRAPKEADEAAHNEERSVRHIVPEPAASCRQEHDDEEPG